MGANKAPIGLFAQETMFFYGFEDGGADSTVIDSIMQLRYYDTSIGVDGYKDSVIYLNSPVFVNFQREDDSFEVVNDAGGTINPITGQGGNYFLKVVTDAGDANTYDRALKIRGIPIEDETSVQYFNLNGVEISSPQAGINIRVTVNANGTRKIEKVLVK